MKKEEAKKEKDTGSEKQRTEHISKAERIPRVLVMGSFRMRPGSRPSKQQVWIRDVGRGLHEIFLERKLYLQAI